MEANVTAAGLSTGCSWSTGLPSQPLQPTAAGFHRPDKQGVVAALRANLAALLAASDVQGGKSFIKFARR